MDILAAAFFSAVAPRWVQRIRQTAFAKKWKLAPEEIVFYFSIIVAVVYLFYAIIQRIDGDQALKTAFFVFTTFWTGTTGSYALLYKKHYKNSPSPEA